MFGKLKKSPPVVGVSGPVERLLVGLGNPGAIYQGTRHNIGFEALDALAEEAGARVDRLKFQALCGDAMVGGRRVLLMKPSTFMNLSGQAVTEAMRFYKIPPQRVLVLCDDIAQPVGRLRIRGSGSDGGHNGLKNIIYLSGSDQFPRIRIGVGQKPRPDYDLADWVLGKFSREDAQTLLKLLEVIPRACARIVEGRLDKAMNDYNSYGAPPKPPRVPKAPKAPAGEAGTPAAGNPTPEGGKAPLEEAGAAPGEGQSQDGPIPGSGQ